MSSPPSPEKRRYDVISGHLTSPLASKRRRVYSEASAITNSPASYQPSASPEEQLVMGLCAGASSNLYAFQDTRDGSSNTGVVPLRLSPPPPSTVLDSIASMDNETHVNRLSIREAMTAGKGTESAYPRHIRDYEQFMLKDQAMRLDENPQWIIVPPHPITATKVATFLQHETTRPKRTSDGRELPGTRLGPEAISQCISALENYRYHRKGSDPRYKDNAEAQKPLRDDERITTYEKNSKAKEPERLAESQEHKALGAQSDTYTREQLIRASMWCLESARGSKLQVHIGVRDRAMLLIGSSTAYRGDNTRRIQLSDLSMRDIAMVDIGPDVKVTALVLLSDQGKTNTTGRIDEQGAFRHRKPELCPVGGLGFYFFSLYHLMDKAHPEFAPNYSRGGELGYRSWYRISLFPGSGGDESEMTYENHRKRVNLIHVKNDIAINKVTHAGRPFAAMNAREHRATSDDTRALGNWSQSGSFREAYERSLPTDAMLAAASFNGRKQESYFVARDTLDPPMDLCQAIFPWVEDELAALKERCTSMGRVATDVSLARFLDVLQRLRRVILQDAAVLSTQYRDCELFRYAPFNTTRFSTFAATAADSIQRAEEEARHRLSALPETIAGSLRGIVTSSHLQQELFYEQLRKENAHLTTRVESFDMLLRAHAMGSSSQRRKAFAALTPQPSSVGVTSDTMPAPPAMPLTTLSLSNIPSSTNTQSLAVPPSSATTISLSGQMYPATTFLLSRDPVEQEKQLAQIDLLEKRFSPDRMRKHQFQWIRSSTESQGDEWRPIYFYWKPAEKNASPTIEEIWTEYAFGMNGHLSVSELNAGWSARWRGSGAARTETSRRKKIITLIETLSAKPNWNSELALRFLKAQYHIPNPSVPYLKTTRAFIDRLQKADGQLTKEILDNSDVFTSSIGCLNNVFIS